MKMKNYKNWIVSFQKKTPMNSYDKCYLPNNIDDNDGYYITNCTWNGGSVCNKA